MVRCSPVLQQRVELVQLLHLLLHLAQAARLAPHLQIYCILYYSYSLTRYNNNIVPHLLAEPLVVPAELLDGELRPRLGLGQLRDLVTNIGPVSGYCLQAPGDNWS